MFNQSAYIKWYSNPVNREKSRARVSKWSKDNRGRKNDYVRKWNRANPKSCLINKAKHRAKKKGFEFSITVDDFDLPDVCPVLGIPLVIGNTKQANNSPTLDRLDSSKGYISGNVRVISWRANDIKRNSTIEELEAIIRYMKGNNYENS
jgi:hypothetical protein